MLYRENGQFKTSYRVRPADLPDPAGPDRDRRAARAGLRRRAAPRLRIPVARDPDPVPDPVARRARPEHPRRLLRPDLARHRRLHGGRRLRGLQLRRCASTGMPLWSRSLLGGRLRDRRRRALRHPVACASRACTSRSPRSRRSSSSTGRSCAIKLVHQRLAVGLGQRRRARACSASRSRSPAQKYLFCLAFLVVFAVLAQEPGARRHRPRVDGDPRHGRRRRGDRHPPGVRQADGLRGQQLHRRRRRRACGASSTSARGSRPRSTSTARSSSCS